MNVVLVTITALAISMVVIPAMLRLAPTLGLIDRPDARKVHCVPMARIGGWGIVLGSLFPAIFWLPLDPIFQAYLIGSLVILVYGTWDDAKGMSAPVKLSFQVIAVLPAVFYADLLVNRVPFMGLETLPEWLSVPLTLFALVGMVNASNLSDGLDGLAGGESLLSLFAIALLAYQADGTDALLLAAAAIGGILGFLRFNTYPARLFMGDSGSQFLGFTLGFLAVLLTQQVNSALSPVVALLLLGLPVVDVLLVMTERLIRGVSPFKPMKNHIHHRVMQVGFGHYETVVVIYSIQALLVVSAALLRYASDLLLAGIYLAVCGGLVGFLLWAEWRGWRVRKSDGFVRGLSRFVNTAKRTRVLTRVPLLVLRVALPLYIIMFSVGVSTVPRDFSAMSALLLGVLILELLFRKPANSVTVRGVVYVTAVFIVYLSVEYQPQGLQGLVVAEQVFFVVVALCIALAVRFARGHEFQTTPMDYLMVLVVVTLGFFGNTSYQLHDITGIIVKAIVLLYGAELLLHRSRNRWNGLNLSAAFALVVMGLRGLL